MAILKEEPAFFKKLEFLNLFIKYLPYDKEIVIPDLDLLSQTYGRANDYLHCSKRTTNAWRNMNWLVSIEKSLKQTIPHLMQMLPSPLGHIDLNPVVMALFEKCVS
jgi:hypothetical protein